MNELLLTLVAIYTVYCAITSKWIGIVIGYGFMLSALYYALTDYHNIFIAIGYFVLGFMSIRLLWVYMEVGFKESMLKYFCRYDVTVLSHLYIWVKFWVWDIEEFVFIETKPTVTYQKYGYY